MGSRLLSAKVNGVRDSRETNLCQNQDSSVYIIVEEMFCCFAEDVSREREMMEHIITVNQERHNLCEELYSFCCKVPKTYHDLLSTFLFHGGIFFIHT